MSLAGASRGHISSSIVIIDASLAATTDWGGQIRELYSYYQTSNFRFASIYFPDRPPNHIEHNPTSTVVELVSSSIDMSAGDTKIVRLICPRSSHLIPGPKKTVNWQFLQF